MVVAVWEGPICSAAIFVAEVHHSSSTARAARRPDHGGGCPRAVPSGRELPGTSATRGVRAKWHARVNPARAESSRARGAHRASDVGQQSDPLEPAGRRWARPLDDTATSAEASAEAIGEAGDGKGEQSTEMPPDTAPKPKSAPSAKGYHR